MADLESVPNELKTFIFEMLSVTNLHSVTTVSRTLTAAVEPKLYRDINTNCSEQIPNHVHDSIKRTNIVALCRTLLGRTDLARHIKTIGTCS